MLVTTLTHLTRQVRWSSQRLCRFLGVPYGTFRRWKQRLAQGQPARFRPGPKKLVPLSLEELRGEVARLHHGHERSRGVGALYRRYHTQVSRRELDTLTATVRQALAQQRQAECRHITWQVPGLVWALDDAALARVRSHLLRLHQVQDLASRYKFPPWVGARVLGETVAVHLEHLFLQYGAPLVLKRDNGGNLNQHAVEEVLAQYLVIPLNSPPQYPPYNGGMERAVRELKPPLVEQIRASGPIPASQVQGWAEVLAHDLNHRPRRCLGGQVACRVFQEARSALKAYTRRRRREVFEEINELTRMLMESRSVRTQRQAEAARRLAVETWLQSNGVITITQNRKVLPVFLEEIAHN
jgi:hypothetical protein